MRLNLLFLILGLLLFFVLSLFIVQYNTYLAMGVWACGSFGLYIGYDYFEKKREYENKNSTEGE